MTSTVSEWSERDTPWALPGLPGETADALGARRNAAYFQWQFGSVQEFWRRMGHEPDVSGKRVIDLGCGFGTLSVYLAQRGAEETIGLDLDTDRIAFARSYVPRTFPDIAGALRFACEDICDLDGEGTYDLLVSKDTFEHIDDLVPVIDRIHRLLKPGGLLCVGTSPLYFSPFGDHGRYFGRRLPWVGAIPEPLLFRLARWRGVDVRHARDVGLNRLTPAIFRSLFDPSAWSVETIRYNAGDKPFLSFLNKIRALPFLERYATVSIYAVIRKK